MKGKIVIKDNKVYFEPDGLEEPKREDFYEGKVFLIILWKMEIRDYKTSKQLVEVSNSGKMGNCYFIYSTNTVIIPNPEIKNGQNCEAEVTDKAVITKIN